MVEGIERGTRRIHGTDMRLRCTVDLEAARALDLRRQVDVGNRRCVAGAEIIAHHIGCTHFR
jgi:hypothetical protein